MQQLNLPSYSFRFKSKENNTFIFDIVRKKYVVLTPEEWVRQHIVHFLHYDKKYPLSIISIEKQLVLNNLKKRTDIVVFDKEGKPNIIVECKAPSIKISQETFDQIARYNLKLEANFLFISNGIENFYCFLNHLEEKYEFLKELPSYKF